MQFHVVLYGWGKRTPIETARVNERTRKLNGHEGTNERTNERTNEGTNERPNERTNATDEWTTSIIISSTTTTTTTIIIITTTTTRTHDRTNERTNATDEWTTSIIISTTCQCTNDLKRTMDRTAVLEAAWALMMPTGERESVNFGSRVSGSSKGFLLNRGSY